MAARAIINAIKNELDSNPGVYGALDDQTVADTLNIINIDNWVNLSSAEIFETIDISEFNALSAGDQGRVDRILGLEIGIRTAPGSKSRSELISVFGTGSVTITSLAGIANQQISRATQIGIPAVRVGWVTEARS